MLDGLGRPQNLLVLGGTSQIGYAIADELLPDGGTIILAGRDEDRLATSAAKLARPRRQVETMHYDACAPATATVDVLAAAAARHGDLDVIVLCAGVLTDESLLDGDTAALETAMRSTMLGPIVAVHAATTRLREQGHGTLVVLSSVAAIRTRDGLLSYGVAKAALDVYARRVGAGLRASGARVLVVRPGHVRTRMTAGLPEPPLTTEAHQVARRVQAALRGSARVVYAPALLGPVMTVLRVLPPAVYRALTTSREALR